MGAFETFLQNTTHFGISWTLITCMAWKDPWLVPRQKVPEWRNDNKQVSHWGWGLANVPSERLVFSAHKNSELTSLLVCSFCAYEIFVHLWFYKQLHFTRYSKIPADIMPAEEKISSPRRHTLPSLTVATMTEPTSKWEIRTSVLTQVVCGFYACKISATFALWHTDI